MDKGSAAPTGVPAPAARSPLSPTSGAKAPSPWSALCSRASAAPSGSASPSPLVAPMVLVTRTVVVVVVTSTSSSPPMTASSPITAPLEASTPLSSPPSSAPASAPPWTTAKRSSAGGPLPGAAAGVSAVLGPGWAESGSPVVLFMADGGCAPLPRVPVRNFLHLSKNQPLGAAGLLGDSLSFPFSTAAAASACNS